VLPATTKRGKRKKMKKVLATISLAVVFAAAALAQTTTTTTVDNQGNTVTTTYQIQPFMTQNNLSWEDAAAALALSKATGFTPDVVVTDRGPITTSYYDLAPAYVIAQQSGKPFSDIMNMYNNGMTWMQIANQLNVSPTYWNPGSVDTSAWTNADFTNNTWRYIMQNQYAMSPEDYTYFTTNNVPMNEVVVSEVYANQFGQPVRTVYTTYTTDNSQWPTVYTYYSNPSNFQSSSSTSYQRTETVTTTTPTTTEPIVSTHEDFVVPANHHTQTVFSPGEYANISGYSSSYRSTFHMRRAARKHRRHYTRRCK